MQPQIDDDTDLRRSVLESRIASYKQALVNQEYEARTIQEIGRALKTDMSQELNQVKQATRRLLVCLKATERYLTELDAPPDQPNGTESASDLMATR